LILQWAEAQADEPAEKKALKSIWRTFDEPAATVFVTGTKTGEYSK
jgi:hypothetical protein